MKARAVAWLTVSMNIRADSRRPGAGSDTFMRLGTTGGLEDELTDAFAGDAAAGCAEGGSMTRLTASLSASGAR